jgi:hypothetical protein
MSELLARAALFSAIEGDTPFGLKRYIPTVQFMFMKNYLTVGMTA